MGSWVLILSLMAGGGTEMHSIKGFESKEKCDRAGVDWKTPIDKEWRKAYSFYSCSYVDK